jgi:acyl-CoA thioesterase FadM
MAHIKIDLPTACLFSVDLPVRITDINYGNHLGNDALVGLLQEARVRWLQPHGWTELIGDGIGLIQVDLAIRFKREARFGDVLTISLQPTNWTARGFDLLYRVTAQTGDDIAHARSGFLFYDYNRSSVVRRPPDFRETVEQA